MRFWGSYNNMRGGRAAGNRWGGGEVDTIKATITIQHHRTINVAAITITITRSAILISTTLLKSVSIFTII